jgi:hypothetical protein
LAAQENLTEPALINLSLVGENDGSESVFWTNIYSIITAPITLDSGMEDK